MSIDDSTSENTPVIKSRTGKFLQGMFDKKPAEPTSPVKKSSSETVSAEFIQVVPEPTIWDESEESNWDDDFVETSQPAFIAHQTYPIVESTSPVTPPPPPSTINSVPAEETDQDLPTKSTEEIDPPQLIEEAIATESRRPLAVNIPRPKNIKYKTKDPNAVPAPSVEVSTKGVNEAIEMDIQRPKNIKYKTKPLAKPRLPDRLLAPIKSLWAKLSKQFDRSSKTPTDQLTPGESSLPTKSWQLPFLGHENFRQILGIVGAVFLAMTVAWAAINFWPRSIATTTLPSIAEPALIAPQINPEAASIEAVKNRSQALASLYPAGLIANFELNADQKLATVIVGNLWFSLTTDQQQQTAQSLWQQAQNYQMSGLEVRTMTDRLIARNPFVGINAVLVP